MLKHPKSFADHEDMLKKCRLLENQGKQTWDLDKKAELFFQAAKIRKSLGHYEAESFCLANYEYATGLKLLKQKETNKAANHLWRSTELFINLENAWMSLQALHCFIRAYSSTSKDFSWKNLERVELAISKIQEFLDESDPLRNSSTYLTIKLRLLEQKAILLKKQKTVESLKKSITLQEEAKKLAKILGKQGIVDRLEIFTVLAKIRIARLQSKDPLEISKLYFLAAELSKKKGKERHYLENLCDGHKFMALHYLDESNFPAFFDHVDKSLEYARQAENDASYWFVLGLKNRVEANLEKQFGRKLKCMKLAKECFYKSGDKRTGKIAEFHMHLARANHLIKNGKFDAYLKELVKVSRTAKSLGYNIEVFEMEKARVQALLEIMKGNFSDAAVIYKRYVQELKKIGGETKFYERMNYICKAIEYLSRSYFTKQDVIEIADSIKYVSEKKLGEFLFDAYTLLSTFVSTYTYSLLDASMLNDLRNQIARLILGQEENGFLGKKIEDLKYLSQFEWYLKYPEHIISNYENFEWFLCDCPPDLKDTAFDLFYRQVFEPLLRIIVEFNSKLEWKNNWKLELDRITQDSRPVEKYSLGLLVRCIRELKRGSHNYCNQLSEKTLMLLDKHVEIRNKLTHATVSIDENLMKREVRSLLYELRICTPVLLLIQQRRSFGYRTRLLWRRSPYQVQLKISEPLQENTIYYTSPFIVGKGREIIPEVLIAAREGSNQYEAFLAKLGRFPTLGRYKEYIFLRMEEKPLVKLKELAAKIAKEIVTAWKEEEAFTLEMFENVFTDSARMKSLRMLSINPRKMMNFMWEVLTESFKIASEKRPYSFEIVSICFESLLMIMESYFGKPWRTKMIKEMQRTITKMFKNIVLGGKGVGRYFKVETKTEMRDLLNDFRKYFERFGIKSPTLLDIGREARLYVHSFIESELQKDALLLKIQEITGTNFCE